MIFFIAGSIYLPALFVQPQYNFLYESGNDSYYYNQHPLFVQNGKLVLKQGQKNQNLSAQKEIRLKVYDVAKNKSRGISFKEGENLKLDSNLKSPDGFKIVYDNHSGELFPLFFKSEDYSNLYLKGHNVSKKLNIQLNNFSYLDFHFIGWIK